MENEQGRPLEEAQVQTRQQEINARRAVALRARRAARVHREMVAEMDAIMEGREPDTNHFK